MVTQAAWWVFVLAGPVIYWLLPARLRAPALGLASLIFVGFYAPIEVGGMLAIATSVYLVHRKPELLGGVMGQIARSPWPVLGLLIYLFLTKYLPAFATALAGQGSLFDFVVPIGVSYFAFKLLHYVIDHRWQKIPAHTYGDYLSYVFLMPIFTAGPIERFDHYLANRDAGFRIDQVVEGGFRIVVGLIKKFWIAVLVAQAIETVAGGDVLALVRHLDTTPPWAIWAFLYLSLLAIYLDFSAYSDIAIGASRLFGLRIMENFNYPFLATSHREFWLRWHMTLASWCRTYIYMPIIGLTRNPYWAVVATFVVMGTWHAGWPPHWILWGLWHGVGSVVLVVWSRFAQKRKIGFFKTRLGAVAGWAMTMSYVALGGAFTALWNKGPLIDSFRLLGRAFALPV